MSKGRIRVTHRLRSKAVKFSAHEPYSLKPRCMACGSRLTKESSIRRGYGDKCWKENGIIILKIEPGVES